MKWSRDLWKREKMIDRGNGKMTTDSRLSTAEPPVKRETEVSSEGLDRGGGWGGGWGGGSTIADAEITRRVTAGEGDGAEVGKTPREEGGYVVGTTNVGGRLRRAQQRDEPRNFYLGPTDVNERGVGDVGGRGMAGRRGRNEGERRGNGASATA